MPKINIVCPFLIEMINAKVPDVAQWRLKYSGVTEKKEHSLKTQRGQLQT